MKVLFSLASKNLRYSEAVLVSYVVSLIDTKILCPTVKKGCINHYIIAYKILNICLLFIFQQALITRKHKRHPISSETDAFSISSIFVIKPTSEAKY